MLGLKIIRVMAEKFGWKEIDFQEKTCMISFFKDDVRINIYYTTGTVATCLNHPRTGKSQLFRRNVNFPLLEEIFNNPRVHTNGRGYKTLGKLQKKYANDSTPQENFKTSLLRRLPNASAGDSYNAGLFRNQKEWIECN